MARVDLEPATPRVEDLPGLLRVLGGWQHDAAPLQLHPGDLGWTWRHGAADTAAALRTWSRAGRVEALAFLDGPGIVRLTTSPGAARDASLGERVVEDLARPDRGVAPEGEVAVESPTGSLVADLLLEAGWRVGEAWTPLRRDLADPVPEPGLRVEVVGPAEVAAYVGVHRSAFTGSRLTEQMWATMAAGPAYADAQALLVHDDRGRPVAGVTVWSAGPGRPGLLEPMGVHADHRGHGHGRAACLAAAAALRGLGATQALVCTPSANVGAVATYAAAGFERLPERFDRARPTPPPST